MSEKVVVDPDRYKGCSFWRRFPGLNVVTMISTLNSEGEGEVSFQGMGIPLDEESPHFLLTCSANSPLYKNISQWGEFIVNFPGADLVERLHFWALNFKGQLVQPAQVGLKTEVAHEVKPLRIQDCYAHLECRLEREIYHQGYIMIIGRVLAGYLDRNLVGSSGEMRLSEGLINEKMIGYIFPFGYSLIERVDYITDNP